MKQIKSENKIVHFLWQRAKPYKWWFILMLQAPLVGAAFIPANQYATKLIIDIITQNPDFSYSQIFLPILIFIIAGISIEVSWRLANFADYKSLPHFHADIINNIYSYVTNHEYRFFQDNLSGTISSKVKEIADKSQELFDSFRFSLIEPFISIMISLFLLYSVSSQIALLFFLYLISIFYLSFLISKKIHFLSKDYTKERQGVSGLITDSISNISSIFLFASRKRERKFVDKGLNKLVVSTKKMLKYEFILHAIFGIISLAASVGSLFLIIHLRKAGKVTIGDFALVIGLVHYAMWSSFNIIMNLKEFVKKNGELIESFSIFNDKWQNKDNQSAKKLKYPNSNISFNNISFSYDKKTKVFDKLNLNIKSGEKIGLVGKSGAGKSTLINLLLKYFRTNEGNILIGEQDIAKINPDSLRENIAVIPQDTLLFHRTILDNIAYGKEQATKKEIIDASKKAHIDEYITTLDKGYNTYVGERGVKLSGGQRQRIAIARAILKDAPILILDEATSSLDSKTEKLIQESLNLLIEDKSKTVIAIAHRLSTLKHMDRIIVMDKGKIIEEGTHDELLKNKNSLYKKLWELQEI